MFTLEVQLQNVVRHSQLNLNMIMREFAIKAIHSAVFMIVLNKTKCFTTVCK
jgi:hypothetical protein